MLNDLLVHGGMDNYQTRTVRFYNILVLTVWRTETIEAMTKHEYSDIICKISFLYFD